MGGVAVKWSRLGHDVLFVSLTNGDAGHYEMPRDTLAQRRLAEAERSAAIGNVKTLVLDCHDGQLEPTLPLREEVVRIIRRHRAHLVLTHRPWDYHPDHRYTAAVVQDAAFMVTVPHMCPDTPRLDTNPVFMYLADRFTKPVPFRADVGVDITDVAGVKFDMLDAMQSQMYEWLPWLAGQLHEVPSAPAERRAWLETAFANHLGPLTAAAREARVWIGPGTPQEAEHAEGFEVCEYGRQPSDEELRELFPF